MTATTVLVISLLIRVFDPFTVIAAVALGGWWARRGWQFVAIGIASEAAVDAILAAARPGYAVSALEFALGAFSASAWAVLARKLVGSAKVRLIIARLQKTKTYDLAAALPLIAWYAYGIRHQMPLTWLRLSELAEGRIDLLDLLQLVALMTAFVLSFLIIVLLIARSVPLAKAKGILPRLVAIGGTFLGNGFLHLNAVQQPLPVQAFADVLLIVSAVLAIAALLRLKTAFSMIPEARRLVMKGPYALVRHPLYAAELVGFAGLAMQFEQPWAGLLFAALVGLQYWRTVFEEQVLSAAYPDYAAYQARTWRFVPYLF